MFEYFVGACGYAGCMDPLAINYDPIVTMDDGSCMYSGCTDPTALLYIPIIILSYSYSRSS